MSFFQYPLELPSSPAPTQAATSIAFASGITTSPYSNIEYNYNYNRYKYMVSITLPPMKIQDARLWYSFFQKLQGSFGSFLMPDFDYDGPSNPSLADVFMENTFASSSAGENEISVDSTRNNLADALVEGEKIQVGTGIYARTYTVAEAVDFDSNGRAVVKVTPPLDINVPQGTDLFVDNPKHLFRLTSEPQSWSSDHIRNFGISFSAESTSKGSP